MTIYLTPGAYFERPRALEAPLPQRTDVAGFVGLAERGPLHQPERLTNWRQFQQIFGGFLSYSHLAYAVRGFFENSGRACWVVRIADADTAKAATRDLLDDHTAVAYQVSAANPGAWGHGLEVSVQAGSLAASSHVVIEGLLAGAEPSENRLAVASISGFEAGSWVRVIQTVESSIVSATLKVFKVDAIRGVLTLVSTDTNIETTTDEEALGPALTAIGFRPDDSDNPISVESLEFTLLVWEGGQVAERFSNLAPDESHTRYAVDLVNSNSILIRLERGDGEALPSLPWRDDLAGGANGLRTINIFDYTGTQESIGNEARGLKTLEAVDEISLLVMPDLTLRPETPAPSRRAPKPLVDECDLSTLIARVDLTRRAVDAETGEPLPGVRAEVSDGLGIHSDETDLDGRFSLVGLLPGSIELVLNLEGYEEKTELVDTEDAEDIKLVPLDLPPALREWDIAYGQSEMIAQCERLRDRFALIEPPLGVEGQLPDLSKVQSWRAQFDTQFAAIYYPWLIVRNPLEPDAPLGRAVPPTGHVAGIYASTDLAEGVFRPPANRALAFVEDLSAVVDDAMHGILNPIGVNVIRPFPGRDIRVYGARTMSSDSAWRFVNVRRFMSMLEETLYDSLQWAVFEPNNTQLRYSLRLAITSLLDRFWKRGAFVGNSPEEAYLVRCDDTTTTPEDATQGRVIAVVGVAPTVPYEFIIIRLGVTTDELQISEV